MLQHLHLGRQITIFLLCIGITLLTASSCSPEQQRADTYSDFDIGDTEPDLLRDSKGFESSPNSENDDKDEGMDQPEIDLGQKSGIDQSSLSLRLDGTGIEQVVITIDDFSFDVLTAGPSTGMPVLLLHGFPNTNYQWRAQITALADAGFLVFAPNQRGYSSGARPEGVGSYSSDKLVEDIRGIVDALNWEAFHLIGHDWGAFIAWEFAGIYPDRLLTLIPISVPHPEAFALALADPNGVQAEMSSYVEFFRQVDSTNAFLADDAALLKSIYESAGLTAKEMEPYLEVLGLEEALDSALHWYRANDFSPPLDQITNRRSTTPDISVPTMYIWSTQDTALGEQAAELTENFVSGEYKYEVFEGVNHWVSEVAPEQLNTLILDFLAEQVERIE